MARYIVLTERSTKRGDDVTFIRDGFHVLAFALPVLWLLWNRLWLHAALTFAVMGMVAAALHQYAPLAAPALTGLVNVALGLLVALEGPAWLAAGHERNGVSIKGAIIARNLREAEEIFAADMPAQTLPPRASFRPVSQSSLIPLTGA